MPNHKDFSKRNKIRMMLQDGKSAWSIREKLHAGYRTVESVKNEMRKEHEYNSLEKIEKRPWWKFW